MKHASTFQLSKRKVTAILAAIATFGIIAASAATLGGLQTDAIGANSNIVEAPVTEGVAITWQTAYSADETTYVVTGIDLTALGSDESIPTSAKISVTVTDAEGAALGEFTSPDGGSTWSGPAVAAHDIEGASIVINGGAVSAAETSTK